MTIKINALDYRVTVHVGSGDQIFSFGNLDEKERGMARERLVDYWCSKNGYAPVYS